MGKTNQVESVVRNLKEPIRMKKENETLIKNRFVEFF